MEVRDCQDGASFLVSTDPISPGQSTTPQAMQVAVLALRANAIQEEQSGCFGKAEELWKEATGLAERYLPSTHFLARVAIDTGTFLFRFLPNSQIPLKYLKAGLSLRHLLDDGEVVSAAVTLAKCLIGSQRFKEAEETLSQLDLSAPGTEIRAMCCLGMIEIAKHDVLKAESILREAEEKSRTIEPELHAESALHLCEVWLEKEQYFECQRLLPPVVQFLASHQSPSLPLALSILMKALIETNQFTLLDSTLESVVYDLQTANAPPYVIAEVHTRWADNYSQVSETCAILHYLQSLRIYQGAQRCSWYVARVLHRLLNLREHFGNHARTLTVDFPTESPFSHIPAIIRQRVSGGSSLTAVSILGSPTASSTPGAGHSAWCSTSLFQPSTGASTFGSFAGTSTLGSSTGTSTFGSSTGASIFGSSTGTSNYGLFTGASTFGSSTGTSIFGPSTAPGNPSGTAAVSSSSGTHSSFGNFAGSSMFGSSTTSSGNSLFAHSGTSSFGFSNIAPAFKLIYDDPSVKPWLESVKDRAKEILEEISSELPVATVGLSVTIPPIPEASSYFINHEVTWLIEKLESLLASPDDFERGEALLYLTNFTSKKSQEKLIFDYVNSHADSLLTARLLALLPKSRNRAAEMMSRIGISEIEIENILYSIPPGIRDTEDIFEMSYTSAPASLLTITSMFEAFYSKTNQYTPEEAAEIQQRMLRMIEAVNPFCSWYFDILFTLNQGGHPEDTFIRVLQANSHHPIPTSILKLVRKDIYLPAQINDSFRAVGMRNLILKIDEMACSVPLHFAFLDVVKRYRNSAVRFTSLLKRVLLYCADHWKAVAAHYSQVKAELDWFYGEQRQLVLSRDRPQIVIVNELSNDEGMKSRCDCKEVLAVRGYTTMGTMKYKDDTDLILYIQSFRNFYKPSE